MADLNSLIPQLAEPKWSKWPERSHLLAGGCTVVCIAFLRFLGLLQPLEWQLLDRFLLWRPEELVDERITLITIDEADIEQVGSYPISDQQIAQIVKQLKTYKPRAIGLDIFRDVPIEPGHAFLQQVFENTPELIAINSIDDSQPVSAPQAISPEQVGFVDIPVDADGFVRRDRLGAFDRDRYYHFSLTIRLVEAYLEAEGITLENGIRNPAAMRFDVVELPQFRPNSGSYVGAPSNDDYGILLSPRNRAQPFRQISIGDLFAGKAEPDWLRDRIVLIGVTAPSIKDVVNAGAIRGKNPGLVTGVEYRAHAVSQILAAVLDARPLLRSWSEPWDYLWILAWGGLGLGLASLTRSLRKRPGESPRHQMLGAGLGAGSLTLICYVALCHGWWLPLVPALLGFGFNSTVLYAFQLYDWSLKARLQERQTVIEQSFDEIHTGPLQSLSKIQRDSHGPRYGQGPGVEQLRQDLQQLDQELRQVYKFMLQEAVTQEKKLYLDEGQILSLEIPLNELLFHVYATTLKREFPCFRTLKVRIVDFEAMADAGLDDSLRKDLGRFLQEAICNVGKYAEGVTRLQVTCKQVGDRNLIEVIDNGLGFRSSDEPMNEQMTLHPGQGTRQARRLARALGGTFERSPRKPKGVRCHLSWPVKRSRNILGSQHFRNFFARS